MRIKLNKLNMTMRLSRLKRLVENNWKTKFVWILKQEELQVFDVYFNRKEFYRGYYPANLFKPIMIGKNCYNV